MRKAFINYLLNAISSIKKIMARVTITIKTPLIDFSLAPFTILL